MTPLARLAALPVQAYRLVFSPWVGHNCRFQPTCSGYALEALERHGALQGGWLTLRRIARCHPWGASGYDPVPGGWQSPAPSLGCVPTTARKHRMTESYTPPKVWTWDQESGGHFASINRPIAGPTHDKQLPVGDHPFQLYSLATPNGVKVTVMFEELLASGHADAEYDAWHIDIGEGDQFGSGFVEINPNSKIPALMDRSGLEPVRVFESGAILLHLAEKFDAFLGPREKRAEMLSWLFWQMGSAPYLGGGFGHFYAYAPEPMEYPINRFTMEVKRQLDVLDRHLAESRYMVGDDYTIADMAIWPWYGRTVHGESYDAGEFLDVQSYKNVRRWADEILERPPVQRGRMVNKATGDLHLQLRERHDASDFETRTQDKLEPED